MLSRANGTVSKVCLGTGLWLALMACAGLPTIAQAASSVYVTTEFSSAVSQYQRDSGGLLTPLAPATVATDTSPQGIARTSDGRSVYVANLSDSTLSQFDSDPSTGALSPKSPGTLGVGSSPTGIAVAPGDRHAYVTSTFNIPGGPGGPPPPGFVQTYGIDPSTGVLAMQGSVPGGRGPTAIAVAPGGLSLYVADSSGNTVSQYSVDAATGALTPDIPPTVATGAQPSGIALSPDGKHAYVTNMFDNTVSQYGIDAFTGQLTPMSPATVATGTEPFGIAVTPDGHSAYVTNSNSSDDSVAQYDIDPLTGALSAKTPANVATGDGPLGVTVSPDGKSAYVANDGDDTVAQYTIQAGSETLTPASPASVPSGAGPVAIAVMQRSQAAQSIVFTSTPPAGASVGGSYTVTATGGGSGNPVTFSIDASSGSGVCSITGAKVSFNATGACVIDADQAGDANFTAAPQAQQILAVVNQPPSITSGASTTVGMRSPFDFKITTAGFPTAAIAESGALPAGVTFIDNGDGTADLAGAAAAGTAGSYPLTITASNGVGGPAIQAFVLTVNSASSAPAITSASSDTETFGVSFSFTVGTTGYPAPKLTKSGVLPSGVIFVDNGNGTATISGTPGNAAIGVYSLTLTAKSSAGTATQAFTLTVSKAPIIKSIPTTTAHVGSILSLTITAKGYTIPAVTESGTLPNGLRFIDNGNGTAKITGTPAVGSGGAYVVTITATNALGAATQSFTLKVDEPPTMTSAATATATIGSPFSFQVAATGYPAPKLTKTGALPKGVTFSAASGIFSGTPKAGTTGSYPIIITAINSSKAVTQLFNLTVH